MTSLKTPQLVLIDVDGTLVDSVPDLAYCADQMMLQLGLPERGEDAVRQWVGNGVEKLVKRALANSLDGEPADDLFDKALPIFWSLYENNVCVRSRLYDGVMEGLDYLKSCGYRLGCVTNKARSFTIPLLEQIGISQYFEVSICGDDTARKKPDPSAFIYRSRRIADCTEGFADAGGFEIRCTGRKSRGLSDYLHELWL